MTKLCSGGCDMHYDESELNAKGLCEICASFDSLHSTLQKQGKIRFYGEQQQLPHIDHSQPKEKD